MPRHEVLRMLEEADLLITAAVASEFPPERILEEWRKFVSTVERRYEPSKFANDFNGQGQCVYSVREVEGLEPLSGSGESEKPGCFSGPVAS